MYFSFHILPPPPTPPPFTPPAFIFLSFPADPAFLQQLGWGYGPALSALSAVSGRGKGRRQNMSMALFHGREKRRTGERKRKKENQRNYHRSIWDNSV